MPGHALLVRMLVGVPVAQIVHVIVGVHRATCFIRLHGNVPKLGQSVRRARRGRAGAAQVLAFGSAPVLHDFFVLGALVLKPDFHL